MSTNTIARIVGSLLALGIIIALYFFAHSLSFTIGWLIGIAAASVVIAFIITPYITVVPYRWMREVAASDLLAAVIGLTIGLLISFLIAFPLSNLPSNWGRILPFVMTIIFSGLGVTLGVQRKNDIVHIFQSAFANRRAARERERDEERDEEREKDKHKEREKEKLVEAEPETSSQVLLDTSTIIDGRIADISQTGFIIGTLVVPRFVLNELQHIADSADAMRRNRGRRGLEMLNRLKTETDVPVEITDADVEGIVEVDSKLVKMAQELHCPIITNDFNLNRVAELQGVKVLNINELANAVKPMLLPGEDTTLRIMQDGRELGQGVGYLDDGTMIVVEGGRQFMNTTIEVTVTRVLQTVAGRMIFAHPKQNGNTSSTQSSSMKQRQI